MAVFCKVGTVEMLGGSGFEKTNFDLITNVIHQHDTLRLRLAFNPERLSTAQAERIGEYYLSVLECIASQPDAMQHGYHLLASERRQVLDELE